MKKISIIGAGNVGSTVAMRIAESNLADVLLLDVVEGLSSGKAMDLTDASPIANHECHIQGAKGYEDLKGSQVVVITAGFPRQPGMSREELLAKNSSIVKGAAKGIKGNCPDAIIIVVTNPLDAMTYIALKESGFKRNKVMGMAGELDSSRFVALIAQVSGAKRSKIQTVVIGSHGDTMVPILSKTTIDEKQIADVLSKDKIDEVVKRTKHRGAEIVGALKKGSAYYAPSAACFSMVQAILNNSKKRSCVSCYLEGEYGLEDICIGVPVKLGKNGIEEIIKLELSDEENESFKRSAKAIGKTIHGN